MKKRAIFGMIGAASLALSMSSCLGMMESSLDVPLGYGGNVGVTVSNYIPPLVNSWNNWGIGGWNGLGWYPGPGSSLNPIVRPIRPALRPGTVSPAPAPAPPVNNGNGNWRPPFNGNNQPSTPAPSPNRPGTTGSNISYRPVNQLPNGSQGRH